TLYVSNNSGITYKDLVIKHTITGGGSRMTHVPGSGQVTIYRASTGTYHNCTLPTPSMPAITPSSSRRWVYDIKLATLATCSPGLPANFNLEDGDSIFVTTKYVNT